MKLLFVVHRYAPFPGGSEYNVQRMAEEAVRQGHDVYVLSDEHKGDFNGVKVSSDRNIAFTPFDLIIVHGSCTTQDFILHNAQQIGAISPIYYIIVQPKHTELIDNALLWCHWVGCGTDADWDYAIQCGIAEVKAVNYVYGIADEMGNSGFKERYGIKTKRMIMSAGGFLPHKGFEGLVLAFNEAALPDTSLVLMGYDSRYGSLPAASKTVIPIIGSSQQDVFDAMYESDLYVLNSSDEGYGLVLLEAMYNMCPWIARPIAAGLDLATAGYGVNFNTHEELVHLLHTYQPNADKLEEAATYVKMHHMAYDSVKSLLKWYHLK